MKRTEFFKLALAAGLGSGSLMAERLRALPEKVDQPLPRRPLGRTGEQLAIVAFGGNIIREETQTNADRMVHEAFYQYGTNYYDVAPAYGDAEIVMGPALQGLRQQVFLSCKTQKRDAVGAQAELERSLRRLRTDYFDLYQHHFLNSREDVERAFGPGGAMEVMVKAKEQGKTRYLGFSAHTVEAAFYAMEHYDFDTVMFPITYVSWYNQNFGPQVVEKALETKKGLIAIKPGARCARTHGEQGGGKFAKVWYHPHTAVEEIARSYYFTLSQPVTSAIPPMENELFQLACRVAHSFIPLTAAEREELRAEAAQLPSIFQYPGWQS